MLTITLAAVLGLLGVVAVVAYAHQANQRAVAGLQDETVVVAKGAIPAGTSLKNAAKEKLLGTEKLPVRSLPPNAVHSVSSATGPMFTTASVAPGQVLLQNMLTSTANGTTTGVSPPEGSIAVAVEMCVGEAVADYPTPGSYVAVFDTVASKGSQIQRSCDPQHQILNANVIQNGGAYTLLVLPKAEVLAVGQNPSAQNTSSSNSATATADPATADSSSSTSGEVLVTLAVKQADAEKLILIEEVGMPYMALINPTDNLSLTGPVKLFSQLP